MSTITNTLELKEAIQKLESEKTIQGTLLKEEFVHALHKVNPINLIGDQLAQSSSSVGSNSSRLIGLISGFVIKRWIVGKTGNPVRRVLGSAAQFLIPTIIGLFPDKIESIVRFIVQMVVRKKP